MTTALIVGGCSGNKPDSERAASDSGVPDRDACIEEPTSTSCSKAAFLAAARNVGALEETNDSELLAIGADLCDQANTISVDGVAENESMTSFAEQHADAIGVSQVQLVLLTDAAKSHLCPEYSLVFDQFRANDPPIEVGLEATGGSPMSITYSLPGGTEVPVTAATNWAQTFSISRPAALKLAVTSSDGQATACRIAVGDVTVSENLTVDGAAGVTCQVQATDLEQARWQSQP